MKKLIFSLVLFALLIASACNPIEEIDGIDQTDEPIEPTKDIEETMIPAEESTFVRSQLSRETAPQVDPNKISTIAENTTRFALSFYDQISNGEDNIIFSPFSISLALSMALAGAENNTEKEMLEALRFTLPEADIHPAFNALLHSVENSQNQEQEGYEGDPFQLNIANSIWGQSGYGFKENFLDTLALHYGAGLYNVNFIQNPEGAREAINEWIEEETQEKIKDLIPQGAINPLTRLVLANAIYFKGSWYYPFDEALTTKAPFTTLDGSDVEVDMMKLNNKNLLYGRGENYQAVNLPYMSSDFSMTVLIPNEGSFADFEDGLSPDILSAILEGMSSATVNLQMPKFDYETTIDAKQVLGMLGMTEAFNEETANFSGITEEEKLFISEVLHKATITVNEEGTEAAAATVVIFRATSARPEEPINLVIDRPFIYLIRHQPSGSILFMGRVTQP